MCVGVHFFVFVVNLVCSYSALGQSDHFMDFVNFFYIQAKIKAVQHCGYDIKDVE